MIGGKIMKVLAVPNRGSDVFSPEALQQIAEQIQGQEVRDDSGQVIGKIISAEVTESGVMAEMSTVEIPAIKMSPKDKAFIELHKRLKSLILCYHGFHRSNE